MEELGKAKTQAYQLMQKADKYITDIYKDHAIDALERAVADLEEQKERAKKEGDRKLELEIKKEINKIQGLYVEKHQIDGVIKIPDTITFILPPDKDE